MKHHWVRRLWPILMLGWCMSGGALAATLEDATAIPTVMQDGAVSRAVEVTVTRLEHGVRFTVDGLSFADVTAWTWQDEDITAALHAALAEHTAALHDTGVGFEVEWHHPPTALPVHDDGRLQVEAASSGLILAAAAPINCPTRTVFGAATSPRRAVDAQCRYGSKTCLPSGKRHTGMDFSGAGNAVAVATGKVVRVETLHAHDHGMGTNVILRHVLPGPNCTIVYSSYSHLATIDAAVTVGGVVAKGQTLGAIGGSGHGDANAFAPHLHLEIKSRAVTGNPFGVGSQTRTCATGPLNAKANSCWRYVGTTASPPNAPDGYGYLNPAGYLRKTHTFPVYRQVSAGGAHTCALKANHTLACWGENSSGQATPPAGAFQQVSAGYLHICGIRADGFMACWGSQVR